MNDGVRYRPHVLQRPPLHDENVGTRGRINNDVLYRSQNVFTRYQQQSRTQYLLYALIFLLIISLSVIVLEKILPQPQMIDNEWQNPGKFVAERAREHVAKLTSLGPRVAGSHENEVLAVDYLTSAIDQIINGAQKSHKIEVDVVRHSGSFSLTFLDGMTHVYKNIQNVVVRIGPQHISQHSLLINCHYDSVTASPGGSDDAAGCAVMLEVFRIISKNTKHLKHNIIFLFNGAEENLLQASHGFITQHPWAKDVRAFINLEACGAGGRELLFQAGPGNPWILEEYAKSVPYPYASTLAQEIFESGIVPGETDFRIFRDFGNVSGVDFAWAKNGYVYHTKFDSIDQIPLGSLQRTGDNILALTLGIISGNYLTEEHLKVKDESLVFFDVFGAFVLHWSEYIARFVNIAGMAIGCYSVYLNIHSVRKEVKKSTYIKQLLTSVIVTIIFSWIISIISVTLIALLITKLGKAMSWYARPAWLFFLYVCPTVAISMSYFLFMSARQRKNINSPWNLYQIYFDAYNVFWMSILLLCIVLDIRSGFLPLHWVMFLSIGNIIRQNFFNKWRDWKWLCFHMTFLTMPYLQMFYLSMGALYLFVPLMGRAGSSFNSEIVMANMVTIMICFLLSFTMPIVVLVKNTERVISVLFGIFLIATGVLILTPLGFPYSGDPASPAPERFIIVHTQREYYNVNGTLRYSSTGYWLINMDMNSPQSIENIVPEIGAAISTVEDCKNELYCGLPYLVPVTTFLWKTNWIPGPAPKIPIPSELKLVEKSVKNNIISFSFNITGPDHIGIMLSPYKNLRLKKWNILDEKPLQGPIWNERETYFVYYSCLKDCEPLNFSLDLETPSNYKGPSLSIALGGHFLHGKYQQSLRFKNFLSQFPSWTVTTGWTGSYTSWEF